MTPYTKYFVLEITLIFSGPEKFSGFIFYAANLVTSSSLGHITEDDATVRMWTQGQKLREHHVLRVSVEILELEK